MLSRRQAPHRLKTLMSLVHSAAAQVGLAATLVHSLLREPQLPFPCLTEEIFLHRPSVLLGLFLGLLLGQILEALGCTGL